MWSRSRGLLASGLLVLALTACGADPGRLDDGRGHRHDSGHTNGGLNDPALSGSALAPMYALLVSARSDYEPVATTAALAKLSTRVVEGSVVAVSEGREIGDPSLDVSPWSTVLLEIAVDRTHKGAEQRRILIELSSEGHSVKDFAKALPKQAPVVFYGVAAWTPEDGDGSEEVLSESRQWKAAGQVWSPASPQGLLFFDRNGGLAMLDYWRFPEATVADFRPGAGRYPKGVPVEVG